MTNRPFSQQLQENFRGILKTPGAPDVIDDSAPVVPVAVIANIGEPLLEAIPVYANQNGAGGSTLYTVPTGKIARILTAWVVHGVCTTAGIITIQANSVPIVGVFTSAAACQPNAATLSWSYKQAPILRAGQTLVLNVAGTNNTAGGASYVEEDA